MNDSLDLFPIEKPAAGAEASAVQPLAERLRPRDWDQFFGIEGLDPNLVRQLRTGQGRAPSLLLWGPPGSGKTTLARLIGRTFKANFIELSAVMVGVKDVREVVARAKQSPVQTILFVDEIHRFNKAQQDAFLPHVESGAIVLIGATTENPSFYITSALSSRMKTMVLPALDREALSKVLAVACREAQLEFDPGASELAFDFCGGDARRLINLVDSVCGSELARPGSVVSRAQLREFLKSSSSLIYGGGEEHYNVASAFIKSLRGSDPNAALYWGFRMIAAGDDPLFVIRRMIVFASEDIGNADPRALTLAVATCEAFERVGMPEGRIPIAQCITYLATAPKSNRSYAAMHAALDAINVHAHVAVPLHLRNAPTALLKSLDYGAEYCYPHDLESGYAPGVQYLPDELRTETFYEPSEHGYEKNISALMRGRKA